MPIVRAQPVVDVENIVIILVVIPVVVHRLARLREDAAWVVRRLILELRIANVVGIDDVRGKLLQRLQVRETGDT